MSFADSLLVVIRILHRAAVIAAANYSMNFLKSLFQSKTTPVPPRQTLPAKPEKPRLPGKFASAHKFPDRTVVHGMATWPNWTLAGCEPFLTLPPEATAEDLGHAVQTALAGSRPETPTQHDWRQHTPTLLRGLGAKSWNQVLKTSIFCKIKELDGLLEFQPYHITGDTQGFRSTEANFYIPANSSPAEIGAALSQCLALCTTIYDQT